jgi:membrane associated rhomboid family serine protease
MRYTGYRRETLNHIWAIIIVNLLVFIAAQIFMMGRIYPPDLVNLFGLRPALVLQQPWTIITSMFTHKGIYHILANMVTLYFFGSFITRLLGVKNFLIIYFCGGLIGNLFHILFNINSVIPAIGASGAVFALGGTLTVLTPKLKVIVFPIPVPMPLWVAIIGGFLILSLIPSVAWQAHLGGLISGALMGLYYRKKVRAVYY